MDRYLEVIGEGEFIETAKRFIAEVTFGVRAAKDETAFREVSALAAEGIEVLRQAGIEASELVEGGSAFHQPWYWKKQVGQTVERKVILKVSDFGRLNHALEQLEPLQSRNKERRTVEVQMQKPEFEDSSDNKATVLARAFGDAKTKAANLAAAMGCTLGSPILVEEGGWSQRSSGFAGDADWSGDSGRFGYGTVMLAAACGGAAEAAPDLQRPTRTIFVKCRARFELANGP
ncbi:SIMPL domain-containing protein [Anatilimnocola floriformis]|uniref:SIMPL domain-containing protein n=1 Tax=Anatilimnocola floriformis TaxID=2948575 RepID=UPI0020C42F7E|nr:SIMPL domain-containing protein [Anatilimnocola floriformis]